ncbi:MAG TPA: xanthine dehydrogenase family protein molybdopterin-binding subunit, partial [Candidatus Dormibacteraeota bacterium]|nr:xanthine dehydrogenase family protein molybdopterin-binding subunit [Candidatus Dormibacteraeota bacterium]
MAVKASLGGAVKRREDARLITGRGRYTSDVGGEGWLHAVFVRSTLAHARVISFDREAAAAMPGVIGVYLASDLGLKAQEAPSLDQFARPPIASDVVRFVGDIVGVVVAESRAVAADAAAALLVDYDALEAVVDAGAALEPGAPVLHPAKGDNEVSTTEFG